MLDSQLTSRAIRSFVVRNGRMTPAQAKALDRLLPLYGINYSEENIDIAACFGRDAPLWVETGFGNGDALLAMASTHPENNYLGIEVHAPGVGHLLAQIEQQSISNIRVIRHDAIEVFANMLAPGTVSRALLFFPDPWPKKRHHKRRILQPEFLSLIESRLQKDGVLHCATDWAEYAEEMLELLSASDLFNNLDSASGYSSKPAYRPETKFERRGLRLGHGVFDLLFKKI